MRKNLKHISLWEPPKNREGFLRLDLNENLYAPPDSVFNILKHTFFAAVEALKHTKEFERVRRTLETAKDDLYSFFVKHNIEVWPTKTNFLVIKSKYCKRIKNELRKRKILVGDLVRHPFAEHYLRDALRISIPVGKDLVRFQKAFTEAIKPL